MAEVTPVENSDFEERKKQFMERYEALVKELDCDIASGPQYVAIGGGAFCTTLMKEIVDLKNQPIPSPFQNETK